MGLRIAEAPLRRAQSAPRPKLQDDAILAKFRNGEALSSVELDRVMALQSRKVMESKGVERKKARAKRLDVALTEIHILSMRFTATIAPFTGYSPLISAWSRVTRASIYCYSPSTGLTAGRLQRSEKSAKVADMPPCERSLYQVPEHILAAQMMGDRQVRV